jgi:enamine deaminase RidA (YjgF/YER057c/UK114 family)
MKYCFSFLLLIGLTVSLAQAQTAEKPAPGYTYKVDGGSAGKTVYVCGQRPFDADGNVVGEGNLLAQTEQAFTNIKTALAQVGMTLEDVKQVTYHLRGVTGQVSTQDAQQVNSVGGKYLTQNSPRLTTLKNIPKIVQDNVLVEVEVIAIK